MNRNKSTITLILTGFMVLSIYYQSYIFPKQNIFPENTDTTNFLINTMNCHIHNYTQTIVFEEVRNLRKTCGERVIFYNRVSDTEIIFIINEILLYKYYNKGKTTPYQCCYQFVERSKENHFEDRKITYSSCKPFNNGSKIFLEQEAIKVTCEHPKKKTKIYQDAYLILIKQIIQKTDAIQNEIQYDKLLYDASNNNRQKRFIITAPMRDEKKFNVLLIGIDTMSRGRLFHSMPQTTKYLKSHGWLDYRGYQKVEYNTFPNVMAVLTGLPMRQAYKECSQGMHICNPIIIWSKFQKAGYKTAYGEDFLSLPDTFDRFTGFKTIPTDHYTKPFFLIGEHESGNLICHNHLTSPKHILNYARDFTDAYKNYNFFGMFWLNSLSHNTINLPTLHDADMTKFLEELNETGVMNNTIIIFFSDHGTRFGDLRIKQIESYYEERLPMLFIWTPLLFRKLFRDQYANLQINQHRLVTPYDLHLTLNSIIDINRNLTDCPLCTSLFNEVPITRTCEDARIHEKWCTCYNIQSADIKEKEVFASVQKAVSYIQNITKTIKTKECTKCSSLRLKKIYRIHSYMEVEKTVYVIAFQMMPGNRSYEANVVREGNDYKVIDSVYAISSYQQGGNCALNRYNRAYCYCERDKSCKNK